MHLTKAALLTAIAATLSLTPAKAQQAPAAAPENSVATSPFAFADSGEKAKRAAEAKPESGSRVIGGEIAENHAWPWQVALVIASKPVGPDSQFCGGSLVLDQWVLTAAHCVYMDRGDGTYADIPPQAIRVLAGTNHLEPGEGDLVEVEGIYRNQKYDPSAFDNDIALIKLKRPPHGRYATVKVPDAAAGDILETPGVRATVTGWGLTEDGSHPAELKQADIEMLPRDACNNALMEARAQVAAQAFSQAVQVFGIKPENAQESWRSLVSAAPLPMSGNMVCSGTYRGGRGACNGDSGGPLVVGLKDGSFIQAGIVSWGLSDAETQSCNIEAKFSAYTRVANYLDWMKATISANQ